MKTLSKIFFLVVFVAIALAGCNGNTPNIPFLNSPTPTASNTPTPTNTVTPSPTATATLTPTPTFTPTPTQIGGGSGKVLFESWRSGFESEFPDLEGEYNVFISDFDGSNLIPITNGLRGYNFLEAISPDGSKVLISSFSSSSRKKDARAILYVFDLKNINTEPIEIVQGFSQNSYQPAAGWINETEILYIGTGEKGYGIYRTDLYGFVPIKIDTTVKTPEKILAIDAERVYWDASVKKYYSPGYAGDFQAVWWTKLDGSEQGMLEIEGRQVEYHSQKYAFSPDGTKLAWLPSAPEEECATLAQINALGHEGRRKVCHLIYVVDLTKSENIIKIQSLYPVELWRKATELNPSESGYYGDSIDDLIWGNDNSTLYVVHSFRGGKTMTEFFYAEPFSENREINWEQNEGINLWRLRGLTPDGKQLVIQKKLDSDVWEIKAVLIDVKSMTFNETFLNLLNHCPQGNILLLP